MIQSAELDHVVLLVQSEDEARVKIQEAGLAINVSRSHQGQGTSNVCAVLDDMFIEFIWLDGTPISRESERVTIGERGRGTGLPLGLSWRGDLNVDCSPYCAPYLRAGPTIPVLNASLDVSMPLVFGSPQGNRPKDRKDNCFGDRQLPHFTTLYHCELGLKNPAPVADALTGIRKVEVTKSTSDCLEISVMDGFGNVRNIIDWKLSPNEPA